LNTVHELDSRSAFNCVENVILKNKISSGKKKFLSKKRAVFNQKMDSFLFAFNIKVQIKRI
jgi:hypothetical protein